MTRVAVIGAGLSGLVVARRLADVAEVTVFEKSRGPGGRLSTRYAGDFEFDHGAQYITARTEGFQSFLQPLIEAGVVATWQTRVADFDGGRLIRVRESPDTEPHYVGAPRMNRIGKWLAQDQDVTLETPITDVERNGDAWTVIDAKGARSDAFDWLVLAVPAAQSAALGSAFPELVTYCADRPMLGCFALMLGFEAPLDLDWHAARIRNSDIGWIAVNSSKPARKAPFTLVVHSSNDWADEHMEDDHEQILEHLLRGAETVVGADLHNAAHRQLHRWRYANSDKRMGQPYYLDKTNGLAACGDWCIRGRTEEAFTSGDRLAVALLDELAR